VGHVKNECTGSQISWRDYIQKLLESGVPKELFGSWIPSNISTSRISHTVPQPRLIPEEDSDDEDFDLSEIPPKMLKLFMKFKASTPNSSAKKVSQNNSNNSNSTSSNKKPQPIKNHNQNKNPNQSKKSNTNSTNFKPNRNQSRNRGRGRGRGRGAGNESNTNNTRNSSRGRGNSN
jgi:hypothetical protein